MSTPNALPSRRVFHIHFGGPKRPAPTFAAPPEVVARFVAALKNWDPAYIVDVEPVGYPDTNVPMLPLLGLWAVEG